MIVIILGIWFLYSTACIITYHPNPEKDKYVQVSKGLRKIDQILAQYKFITGTYPNSLSELHTPIKKPWMDPFINIEQLTDPLGVEYGYTYDPKTSGYNLCSAGNSIGYKDGNNAYYQLSSGNIE